MTNKEAITYLQPVADSTPMVGYGAALVAALEALREVESLRVQLKQAVADLQECGRKDPCDFCKYNGLPLPCEGADFICDECTHESCVCHACRGFDKWEWRGVQEVQHG